MKAAAITAILSILIGSSALAADKAGYVLLDRTVTQFHELASGKPGQTPEFWNALNDLMALAHKARDEKRIDETFHRRYGRVLMVLRLVTIDDPQRILMPFAERELRAFIKDTTGSQAEGEAFLPELATAISTELDRLKVYLDTH